MCDMDFAVRMGLIWDEGMRKVGTVTGKGGGCERTGDGGRKCHFDRYYC